MKYEKRYDEKYVIFTIYGVIEARVPKKFYERYRKKYSDEEIIQYGEKELYNALTKRRLYYISEESGFPLIGHNAFGLIDRGTNLIQVRPITGCNLNCIFCSVDEGMSRTRVTDYLVDVDYLLDEFEKLVNFKRKYCKSIEAHIDGQGDPVHLCALLCFRNISFYIQQFFQILPECSQDPQYNLLSLSC